MQNQKAMDILMKIEGFRNLNKDLEKIINKSEKIKKIKKEPSDDMIRKKRERYLRKKKSREV